MLIELRFCKLIIYFLSPMCRGNWKLDSLIWSCANLLLFLLLLIVLDLPWAYIYENNFAIIKRKIEGKKKWLNKDKDLPQKARKKKRQPAGWNRKEKNWVWLLIWVTWLVGARCGKCIWNMAYRSFCFLFLFLFLFLLFFNGLLPIPLHVVLQVIFWSMT